jgi:tripartite-type tricarboxylate transporter receptor subunit TctC
VQVTEIAPTFVVSASTGYESLEDVLQAAKQKPGALAATHGTFMSSSHLPLLRLEQNAGVTFNHVPTSGGGETFQFLLGNIVQLAVTTPATIVGSARSGRVLPVAVATANRISALPDTPTLTESGFDIEMPVWYTIFTTTEVPADRVRLLADRIATAYASTEAQILAERAGLEIEPRGLEDTQRIYLQTISIVADTLSGLQE